tara:strand:+ start:68 stop:451 length:384 start_codon:yes stop_codon:yes gene_type:complete
MSITNLSKDIVSSLFQPLILSELSESKTIDKIKSDSASYSKLKLLAQQAELLKMQIKEVIQDGILNNNLHDVDCGFKKVSGNTYYLYKKKDDKYFFSLLSPQDWNDSPPYEYVASYLYDHDKCFRLL